MRRSGELMPEHAKTTNVVPRPQGLSITLIVLACPGKGPSQTKPELHSIACHLAVADEVSSGETFAGLDFN